MGAPEDATALLRQRIDLLEISSQEKRRPWYRQPSNLLAITALLVSIASTIYSQAASKQETIRSKKEEIRKLIINLLEIRPSFLGGASPQRADIQSARVKQFVYLQAAQRLVKQIPTEISSYEYLVLAEESQANGEFPEAEDYFQKAEKASSSVLQRSQARRSLSIFYFTRGTPSDVAKGRETFQRAAQELEAQSDPYSIYVRALNSEVWAATEFQHAFTTEGGARLEEARKLYKQLPPGYPGRSALLDDLDRRVKNAGSPAQTVPPAAGFMESAPQDINTALQNFTADDLRTIFLYELQEGDVVATSGGEKSQWERLVANGLATFMSDKEVKKKSKDDRDHYDYAVRATALYPRTREFLIARLAEAIASGQTR